MKRWKHWVSAQLRGQYILHTCQQCKQSKKEFEGRTLMRCICNTEMKTVKHVRTHFPLLLKMDNYCGILQNTSIMETGTIIQIPPMPNLTRGVLCHNTSAKSEITGKESWTMTIHSVIKKHRQLLCHSKTLHTCNTHALKSYRMLGIMISPTDTFK